MLNLAVVPVVAKMGCCTSVQVYISNPSGEDKQNVKGCFLWGCRGGTLSTKITPKTHPPKEKKKNVIPSPYMFMHIDEHVRKVKTMNCLRQAVSTPF